MQLKALTDGAVSGSDIIDLPNRLFGGVLISTDGTNPVTVTIRAGDANGKRIFMSSSLSPAFIAAPFNAEANRIYYTVSGTGGSAQLYEWIE